MRATDTDRREVASRLRECEPYMSAFPFADYVGRAVDPAGSIETWREVCLRLADLIDPDATRKCDREELLALADEIEMDGAGALDDEDWCKPLLKEYARRIREACGEKEEL